MNFALRSAEKELLDQPGIPFEDIARNMEELNFINTWLGGHAISLSGFKQLLGNKSSISVCEIGCGGGDNLLALVNWCKKRNISISCTGIDINPECIAFARQNTSLQSNTTWICSDYRDVVFSQAPDIIFSSLFCHHLSDAEVLENLRWMKNNCRVGFFINDLERNPVAYQAIKILTRLFSKSYLVKNDAPISVTRGFWRKEWRAFLAQTQTQSAHIFWKWAFRHLIVYQKKDG